MPINQQPNETYIRGTFVDRQNTTEIDYIELTNKLISESNDIKPNSFLYQKAIDQYNALAKKGTLKRLEIPKGFCGYIDPTTGQLRITTDEEYQRRLLAGETLSIGQAITASPLIINQRLPYNVDVCLQYGLPGSPEYVTCVYNTEVVPESASGIDWFLSDITNISLDVIFDSESQYQNDPTKALEDAGADGKLELEFSEEAKEVLNTNNLEIALKTSEEKLEASKQATLDDCRKRYDNYKKFRLHGGEGMSLSFAIGDKCIKLLKL